MIAFSMNMQCFLLYRFYIYECIPCNSFLHVFKLHLKECIKKNFFTIYEISILFVALCLTFHTIYTFGSSFHEIKIFHWPCPIHVLFLNKFTQEIHDKENNGNNIVLNPVVRTCKLILKKPQFFKTSKLKNENKKQIKK